VSEVSTNGAGWEPDAGRSQSDQEKPPTLPEVRQWPASVAVSKAAAAFGISRSHAYELIASGRFPATVIRLGNRYRVVKASIIRLLADDAA